MMDHFLDNAGLYGLLFFFFFFVGVAFWTYRPGARDRYQAHASIPFHEGR